MLNYIAKMTEFLDIHDMVDLQDLPYRIIEVDMQDFPTRTVDEIDFWDLEPIPHACVRLVEGQVLEEFMLEEVHDMSLPKLSRAEESVHNDKIKLETPKINAIERKEKPREMGLEVAIPTRNILGDSIPKLYAKQTKILGSKIGRRANPLDQSREGFIQCVGPLQNPQIDKIIYILRPEIMPGKKQQITGPLPSHCAY